MRYRHVALFVGEGLREAEAYYRDLFDMEVVVREAPITGQGPDAGQWAQLRDDKGWDEAEVAGVDLGMTALQRGDVILPLFAAEPTGERFYAIGLVADAEEIHHIADRLTDEMVEARADGWLAFVDRYGFRWQLSDSAPFLGAGNTRGLWLDV